MCGRFFSEACGYDSREQVGMDGLSFSLLAVEQIYPTHLIQGLSVQQGQLVLSSWEWGLSHPNLPRPVINARIETLADKPMFKQAYQSRRCVIPCSGWYEWRNEGQLKQPYRFQGETPIVNFAGLYWPTSAQMPNGAVVLVTQAASKPLRAYHHRMPLLVRGAGARAWLEHGHSFPHDGEFRISPYFRSDQPRQGQLF